ncbi:hypothetical protein KXS11_15445 [Plantibacter flavus]|uniref:hypothetical protein n=1 Tax=Plantibacter flavus TaxID=150123 RepID=UPI003F145067
MFTDHTPLRSIGRTRVLAALLAVPLLIGGLAACSTGGDAEAEGSPSGGTEATWEDYQLAYAKCMRGEGIDYPDPTAEGTLSLKFDEDNAEAMNTASQKCSDELGTPPAAPGGDKSDAEIREEMLKMAQCFRDNGLDVPDPKEGEAFAIPADAPAEVFEACGLGTGGGAAVTIPG